MKPALILKSALLAAGIMFTAANSLAFTLEGTAWTKQKKVDPYLLYALALKESRRLNKDGSQTMRPWPWVINHKGKGTFFKTKEDAKRHIEGLISKGYKSIDIGILQVNTLWHNHRYSDPMVLLDINSSIDIAADILIEAMNSVPKDIELGVGRYHNWESDELARSYGRDVLNYREELISLERKARNVSLKKRH